MFLMQWSWASTALVALVALPLLEGKSQPLNPLAGCPFECPEECHESSVSDCSDTSLDDCGCCPVCVRSVGEKCGAEGVCEAPLHCSFTNSSYAVCTRLNSMEGCSSVVCPIPFHPHCPDDSRLVVPAPPNGECCIGPGKCLCDPKKCPLLECTGTTDRVLVKDAIGLPGKCCDEFACREKESHCAGTRCPSIILDEAEGEEECPEDSARPPVHRMPGMCCPSRPGCRCRPSICPPASCPVGKKVKVLKKGDGTPGRCCDIWSCVDDENANVCHDDGNTYAEGETWHKNKCDVCRCKRGISQCAKMSCQKPPSKCSWIMIPEDECCPVCAGCQTDSLEKKALNDTWLKDDCTTCTCAVGGEPVCIKHMCSSACDNPRKVEGQCCPVCDEPTILTLPSTCPSLEHCPLRCVNGLRRDERGCFLCDCLPLESPADDCTALDEANCSKQCAHGYTLGPDGCAVCACAKCPPLHQCMKHCLYGFETNHVGCPVCKCRAIARIDARITTSDNNMTRAGKDRCVLDSQTGISVERDGGEWWNDGCRHCFCEGRQEFCSLLSCPDRPADCPIERWTQAEGACCPSCSSSSAPSAAVAAVAKHEHTVCQSPGSGRLFTDGETWQLTACVSCTCRVGHVLCRPSVCPPTPCTQPVYEGDSQCCPSCPASTSEEVSSSEDGGVCTEETGTARAHGTSWRKDDCNSCKCNHGEIKCYAQKCPTLKTCRGKALVLKGRCCPVCSDVLNTDSVCTYGNSVYAVDEEWRDGDCRNCSCVAGGQTICRELVCPECLDPAHEPGQCCKLCKGVSGWASFSGGKGSVVLHQGGSSPPPWAAVAFSAMGAVVLLVLLGLIFLLYRRSKSSKKAGSLSKNASAVRLSASRPLGSQSHLHYAPWEAPPRGERRDSGGAQSESLLSTASSDCSSGHGTAHTDTDPLTGDEPRRSGSGVVAAFKNSPARIKRKLVDSTLGLDV